MKKKSSLILRLLGTLIALTLLVYLLLEQGWEEIWAAVQQIPIAYLVIAFLLMLVSRFMVTARWHVLLRSADLVITYFQTLRITMAGLFATNFLPTTIGGDIVRLAGAAWLGFDATIITASLVMDRLVGMAGMILVLPFGLPSLFKTPPGTAFWFSAPLFSLPLATIGSVRITWQKIKEKLSGIILRLLTATRLWIRNPKALLISLGFSFVHMLCLFLIIDLLFKGMGEDIPFWMIAGLYGISYFVTLIPISINGYGLQELSMTIMFSRFAGASLSSSLTVAVIFRTLMMLASLPGAAFISGILNRTNTEPISNATHTIVE
jgi:hypothetical protein